AQHERANMTTKADTAQPQAEIAPPPLDDEVETAAPAVVERSEQGEQTGPPVTPVVETQFQDARARIARLYRDQRERDEADAASALAEQQAAREAAEAADATGQHQQNRVRIVVDGKEQFLTQAELVQRAQIGSAIDNRLNEAKRILAQAKAER